MHLAFSLCTGTRSFLSALKITSVVGAMTPAVSKLLEVLVNIM